MSGVSKGVDGGSEVRGPKLNAQGPLTGRQSPINDDVADQSLEQPDQDFIDTPHEELGREFEDGGNELSDFRPLHCEHTDAKSNNTELGVR